jgi:hypothetical protein
MASQVQKNPHIISWLKDAQRRTIFSPSTTGLATEGCRCLGSDACLTQLSRPQKGRLSVWGTRSHKGHISRFSETWIKIYDDKYIYNDNIYILLYIYVICIYIYTLSFQNLKKCRVHFKTRCLESKHEVCLKPWFPLLPGHWRKPIFWLHPGRWSMWNATASDHFKQFSLYDSNIW